MAKPTVQLSAPVPLLRVSNPETRAGGNGHDEDTKPVHVSCFCLIFDLLLFFHTFRDHSAAPVMASASTSKPAAPKAEMELNPRGIPKAPFVVRDAQPQPDA